MTRPISPCQRQRSSALAALTLLLVGCGEAPREPQARASERTPVADAHPAPTLDEAAARARALVEADRARQRAGETSD